MKETVSMVMKSIIKRSRRGWPRKKKVDDKLTKKKVFVDVELNLIILY